MTGPRAAKGTFPYPHRTVAEVWDSERTARERNIARIEEIDQINRIRALTDDESIELERRLRRIAA